MFKKVAEHRSRVPPLTKTSVATSFQSSDGWMFVKTVSGLLERDGDIRDYAQNLIQDTLYIKQVLRKQTRLQYSAVE